MINPIKRERISDQILVQLREMIKNNEFPVGSKLPSENQLANLFKVSRPPVREALSILQASGIIESTQGGGRYVKEVNLANKLDSLTFEMIEHEQLFDLLEMRTIIEAQAAALAAERANVADLTNIKNALDKFNEDNDTSPKVNTISDYEFHKAIIKATHNEFIIQSINNLSDLHKRFLNYSLTMNTNIKGRHQLVKDEHYKIYQAIIEKNSEAAASYMKEHLINARIKLGDPRVSSMKTNEK